jgi:hypothetical protein
MDSGKRNTPYRSSSMGSDEENSKQKKSSCKAPFFWCYNGRMIFAGSGWNRIEMGIA